MADVETLERLTNLIDFNFDPTICRVDRGDVWRPIRTVSEVGDTRYAAFQHEAYKRVPFGSKRVDFLLSGDYYDEPADEDTPPRLSPEQKPDESFHGLLENQRGYIAYHRYNDMFLPPEVHRYATTLGPEGANQAYELLGRRPSIDMPGFVLVDEASKHFRAGHVAAAIADMTMKVPDVNDFNLASHDLGQDHGQSWPYTPEPFFRHISQVAQDTVKQHGDRIYQVEGEEGVRPDIVIAIAKCLDNLRKPTSGHAFIVTNMEHQLRNGAYDARSDADIVAGVMQAVTKEARCRQHNLARRLLLHTNLGTSELYRRGYLFGLMFARQVADVRLNLHEARPHPLADEAQTKRTKNVIHLVEAEISRRLDGATDLPSAA